MPMLIVITSLYLPAAEIEIGPRLQMMSLGVTENYPPFSWKKKILT